MKNHTWTEIDFIYQLSVLSRRRHFLLELTHGRYMMRLIPTYFKQRQVKDVDVFSYRA